MSEPSDLVNEDDGWTTGSECDMGEPNEWILDDTDDEEEQHPQDDNSWDYLLLGIVLVLLLVRALHKSQLPYFVQCIKNDLVREPPPPPLTKFVVVYPLLICESAQWLLTKKKYDEAVACLKRVAKFNGRQVEDSAFDEFVKYYREKTIEEEKVNSQEDTFLGMFRTPRLRRFTLTLLLKSVIITLSCDVINRNMEGLGTSPFKLFSFTSIAYLPAGVAILLLQNKIGRKGMACTALLAGGIITTATGCLIAFLDPQQNAVLLAIMVALGRFGATVSYDAEIQYAAEILPTSVRGRALSNIHVAGLASSSVAFYVIYLAQYYKPLPSIFISCLMFFGAGLCLTLPETLDKKLPENLADGESFALNESFFYFPCFHRRQKPKENAVDTA
ncbi:GL12658 [Drosophila persimilis]|uniref:GL12658 n=1 Tax=Drosophila persimilis TaxID=7234 RepID=B4GLW8_DROPE|nr:GL12658 [Drosophila persimilis]